jgi:hypothetical protein
MQEQSNLTGKISQPSLSTSPALPRGVLNSLIVSMMEKALRSKVSKTYNVDTNGRAAFIKILNTHMIILTFKERMPL